MTNPLVAAPDPGQPQPWAGIWIAEDIDQTVAAVQAGSWVDATLGGISTGLDALALVSDPVGGLLQYGVAWLLDHVKPLSEALDWLAGDPDQIDAHARTWRTVASSLQDRAADLTRLVRWDTGGWTGAAGDAYRSHADHEGQKLLALARASEGMALATEGAGMLIGTVRLMVRDALAAVVSRLMVYAGELTATAGLATPLVIEQVSTLCASWAARIARWLKALLRSLSRLGEATRRLADLLGSLRRERPTRGPEQRAHTTSGPMFSKSPVRSNQDVLDTGPGTPMTLDNVGETARRMGIDLDDVEVVIVADPEEIRYLDHMDAGAYTPSELNGTQVRLGPASFADAESLAATIAHEYTHVRQQRGGEHLQTPLRELEDRAYDSEGPALDRYRRSPP